MLGEFLHDLCKIDCCEEVAPRKVGQQFYFLFMSLAIRQNSGSGNSSAGTVLPFVLVKG